jgi:glycerophosphoryl diester phosphodiesterase
VSRAPRPSDVTVCAHRGASAHAPENTLASIREAARAGADLVEVDVHRTKDGVVVAMHDTTLSRTTNAENVFPSRAPYRIRDFTLAEIGKLDAGTWFAPEFAGEVVPTLADVLGAIHGSGSGLLLEVKAPRYYPGIADDVVTELHAHPGWSPGDLQQQLVMQSYDWDFARRMREMLPGVPCAILATPTVDELEPLAAWLDQVHPWHRSIDATYVARGQALGVKVLPWTVNRRPEIRRMLDLGVDGIITDKPALLAQVLKKRATAAA